MSWYEDEYVDFGFYEERGHPALSDCGKYWQGQAFFLLETSHLVNIKALLDRKGYDIPYELERELHLRRTGT